MKIFLILMLAAAPAMAGQGPASQLGVCRAEIDVLGGAPLLDLVAARDKAALPLEIGGVRMLASVAFDAEWNAWFSLKAEGDRGLAWDDGMLAAGVDYDCGGVPLRISKAGDIVTLEWGGEKMEIPMTGLFDRLYEKSLKFTFGGAVTYAVFRNTAPLSEELGTVSLRMGSDGLYYLSVTADGQISDYPRWLLAVNGVLYGLRLDSGSLLFVSKPIEIGASASPERAFPRR